MEISLHGNHPPTFIIKTTVLTQDQYIAMICCEILTIYFFYPETQGRTLEELAFCKSRYVRLPRSYADRGSV